MINNYLLRAVYFPFPSICTYNSKSVTIFALLILVFYVNSAGFDTNKPNLLIKGSNNLINP